MIKSIQNIENGTVIDHITPGKAIKCMQLMNIKENKTFFIAMNVISTKMGLKDFIKIEDYFPSSEELEKISVISPNATISTIKQGKVVEKKQVKTPEFIESYFKCINPKCVTNQEKEIKTKFKIKSTDPLILKCLYCGKQMTDEEITEVNKQQ